MIPQHFQELEDRITHSVRGIIDDHPLTRYLPEVARRNMSNVAGWSAISALTADEIALAEKSLKTSQEGNRHEQRDRLPG